MIQQQQEILGRNGENARKRQNLVKIENDYQNALANVNRLESMLKEAQEKEQALAQDLDIARKDAQDLIDESTQEIEDSIANIEQINLKVRANLDKDKAEEDAKVYREQYRELDLVIDSIRKQKRTCSQMQTYRFRGYPWTMASSYTWGNAGIICPDHNNYKSRRLSFASSSQIVASS